MLVNITEHFIESDREWQVGQNPDVPREVAARWIADGKATADTDGVRNQSPVSGGGVTSEQSGPRAASRVAMMADIDRMVSTRGQLAARISVLTSNTNGATKVPMTEAGMFEPSQAYAIKFPGKTGTGSNPVTRPSVVIPVIGAPVATTAFRGVLMQIKCPARSGDSFVPFQIRLCSDATPTKYFAQSFTVPADGLEHWIALPLFGGAASGGFVAGTDTITHIQLLDRDDVAVLGEPGLQPGESAYIGAIYLNPKGRAKAVIRFDDSLYDLVTATATFAGGPAGTTQAWSCASLLEAWGFVGSCFHLTRRIGTSNALKTFVTWSDIATLATKGWTHHTQTHSDPGSSNNKGTTLLGPYGYSGLPAISAVDTSANTITTAAAHNILQSYYGGFPFVLYGTDLPAPLVAGTAYWARYSTSTAFTAHATEADCVANTGVIDLTTTGTIGNFGWRFSGSANDSSAILNDYNTCRSALIANGIPAYDASIVAFNQGAYDRSVVRAVRDGGYKALGIEASQGATSSAGRFALGESGYPGGFIGSSRDCIMASTWYTLPHAIQTDGAPTATTIRQFVQQAVANGLIIQNYHHGLSPTTGPQLDAYLSELSIQQAAGLLDVVTATEACRYLDAFVPLPTIGLTTAM